LSTAMLVATAGAQPQQSVDSRRPLGSNAVVGAATPTVMATSDQREQPLSVVVHFGGCLKYLRSGGGWSFFDGISLPSTLM
jgi:hypothetical protein